MDTGNYQDKNWPVTRLQRRTVWLSRAGWLLAGITIGTTVGFTAGKTVYGPAALEIVDTPNRGDGAAGSSLVEEYRSEVVRLNQRRNIDQIALREKELTLEEMMRRGAVAESQACQRLQEEIRELKRSIAKTETDLERFQQELGELTAICKAKERDVKGLDRQTKIDAHRFALEHEASLRQE